MLSHDPLQNIDEECNGSIGRAINWGSKGCLFETHRRQNHCVVSFSKTLYLLLSTGLTQEERKLCDVNDNC